MCKCCWWENAAAASFGPSHHLRPVMAAQGPQKQLMLKGVFLCAHGSMDKGLPPEACCCR